MVDATVVEVQHGRIAAARIGPNEDLVDGLCRAVAKLGFDRAVIRSGLGSLIDAVVDTGGGERRSVSGPAIEILSLCGDICLEKNVQVPSVVAILGTTKGEVLAGKLVPGRNLVCVTTEVVIEEIRVL